VQVISFDVKPANVLLDRSGKHAKLADVGLAKVLEHSQTMTNMVGRPLICNYSRATIHCFSKLVTYHIYSAARLWPKTRLS
jgi:serine/threonine protein kinase